MNIRHLAGRVSLLLAVVFLASGMYEVVAQVKPPVGIRQNTPAVHALTNARIVVAPGRVHEKATLVFRDGVITAVGPAVSIPADARVWDLSGATIYPGFIEGYSDIGMPKKPQPPSGQDQQQPQQPKTADAPQGSKYWNNMVNASQHAEDLYAPDAKASEKLRGMGFTTALVVPQKGIFRGTSALINLGDGAVNHVLVKPRVAQHIVFETSGGDEYPNSSMGTIALIRQTVLDAQWHRAAFQAAAKFPAEPRPEFISDLAALEDAVTARQTVILESSDEHSFFRAHSLSKEFGLRSMVVGSGFEYRRLDAVKATGLPIILTVNFPDVPAVGTPEEALSVTLQDLRFWDEAPENPKKLHEAGIALAFTTAKLKDPGTFLANVRKAVDRGLPADAALAALTTTPAKLFGVDAKLGTLDAGKVANVVVTDGPLFSEKTKIRETWIDGRRYEVKPRPEYDPRGTWDALLVNAPVDSLTLVLKGEVESLQGSVKAKDKDAKLVSATFSNLRLELSFVGDSIGLSGTIRMTAAATGSMVMGTGELADGRAFKWTATRRDPFTPEPDTSKPKQPQMASFEPVYPPGEFGRPKIPDQSAALLVRGATIWTCGPQGIIENGDMLIRSGKIAAVGKSLQAPPNTPVIEAQGKHITPGLIDCHSHSAADGSVNETGQAITAEVRIGDIVDADDIALYRELAGGLTTANVLHGSANAIGGQNQVIKLRWGALPEEMKFEGAMPGIKFALGENPKQSNWGDRFTTRYPQTRGGVEQIIRDEFRAALDYEREWKDFEAGIRKIPPRRDLQAQTMLEILRGKRIVHSHSYRQDEILMLVRLADEFGFRIGTFQHVLEGYKVADALARHGAGASCFSDWWAFKFEVYDAIPYAGTLMHDVGVLTSFNSDSDELARRMNTEAAKAVKYGGASPQEALKFVTLNPAKQLRIDNRVGSLETGKDADFAIWNGNPLSTYTMCEQTWIDGRKYFDREEDRAAVERVRAERATLVQKVLSAKKGGGGDSKPQPSMRSEKMPYSCHDEEEGR